MNKLAALFGIALGLVAGITLATASTDDATTDYFDVSSYTVG